MRAAWLVVAACGGHSAPMVDAPPAGCAATFTGNFSEMSSAPANCPALGSATLTAAIPIATFPGTLDVSIDLPAAMPGSYSSETIASWSASAVEHQTDGGCVFRAGNSATPEGSFTLQLDGVAPLHGSLALSLAVLTEVGSSCGSDDVESITLAF